MVYKLLYIRRTICIPRKKQKDTEKLEQGTAGENGVEHRGSLEDTGVSYRLKLIS